MHGVKPEIQKEGTVLLVFNKFDCMVGEDIGQVIARLTIRQSWDICARVLFTLVGKKKRSWLAHFMACHIEIETMVLGVVLSAFLVVGLQVPFPNMGCVVTVFLERFRHSEFFGWHIAFHSGWF